MIKTTDLIAKFETAIAEKWGYIYGKTHEKWTAEKQKAYAQAYAGDPDRKLSCELGGKWVGHWVTDCSGLFAWAFSVLGGKMYHGSNTMWNSWCTAKGKLSNGKRSDGKELLPGTAVFVYNADKNRRTHVGLYIGNGQVIEAAGTKHGCIYSKVTLAKWAEWGELKGVDYSGSAAAEPAKQEPEKQEPEKTASSLPTLRRGAKGEYVTLLQTKLVNKGYSIGPCGIDGDFGSGTLAAVKQFQTDNRLTADGIVGPKTWSALDSASTAAVKFSVTIPHLTATQADSLVKAYPGSTKEEERG